VRRNLWYLVITLVLIIGTFTATLLSGNSPVLGLDLQGGIEVRLQPVGKARSSTVLDKTVDIIRNRVNGLGVAETEVKRDGDQIVVDLPGVKDRDKARRIVGKTAELQFRPVLAVYPAACSPNGASTASSTTSSSTTSSTSSTSSTTKPATSTPSAKAGKGIGAPTAASSTSSSSTSATSATTAATSSTTAAASTSATTAPATAQIPEVTPADQVKRDQPAVLCDRQGTTRYGLAATVFTGKHITEAKASFASGGSGYVVNVKFDGQGQTLFDNLAATSISKTPPENSVAIVLDNIVQSAPAFQATSFPDGVQISGSFSQGDAEDLATVLQFGSLPVQLKELTTTSISPTLGRDQLDAGILAGIIGLILVAVYMLVFYRVLGLVVIFGLALSGMAIYTLLTFLGSQIGLTLTLAGVVGVIVSVGITVDSYVVYFERLKDEIRTGRTVRSSVDRGFQRSFRTILAADLVSLIAAGILYWQAIGSVRQFAFLLGLSTLLDLALSYFYMHPLVQQMARSRKLVGAKGVGIAAGLDTPEAKA
jgi:preprotein translocase subunit SecD